MPITVFHGSPSYFDKFEIKEEYSNRDISLLAEGLGVYLTNNKELASSYGSYLYLVELQKEHISDFTNKKYLQKLIQKISSEVGIDLEAEINTENIIQGILTGNISNTLMYEEINNHLDSSESFYNRYCDLITYEDDCIFEAIKQSFLQNIKDVILYYDKSFESFIYICFRNGEKLKILGVEKTEKI